MFYAVKIWDSNQACFVFQGREEYDEDDGGEEQEDEYEDKRKWSKQRMT